MLSFTIDLTGLDRVREQLDATQSVLIDFYPEMQKVGDYLLNFFSIDVFESEGAVYGDRWADLSPAYEMWKSEQYPGRGILERTSTLRYGFTATPSSDFLVIANNTPYGVHLEYGTERMPARVFMKIDSERADIINNMVLESLNERIADAIG